MRVVMMQEETCVILRCIPFHFFVLKKSSGFQGLHLRLRRG